MTSLPTLKFRTLVNFPAQVIGRAGITVTKIAPNYYIDLDYSKFQTSPTMPAGNYLVTYDPITQAYTLAAAPVSGIPQNSQSANYTTTLTDAGGHIFHPSADTTARTWTIASNASVAYPTGTVITFVNQNAAGVITLAIATDTMRLAGPGTTGNRTLAANGIGTALKVTATEWIISGTGLT